MAADNIREIFKTDTVGEFMNKCNWNFGIISRIGGPRGLQGERGETGARGRRGAMIHTVNEPDEMMDYMDVETASEILSTLDVEETENMEDGDVVFFKNGWVCEIGIEDGEIVAREPVFPIIGPQGPQGEPGASGDTDGFFKQVYQSEINPCILLRNRLPLVINNNIYLPANDSKNIIFADISTQDNNIEIENKGQIGFNENAINVETSDKINIRTSGANGQIDIKTTQSNGTIKFIVGNDIMDVKSDGLTLYKNITLHENIIFTSNTGKIKRGTNEISLYNDKTTFNKNITLSSGNSITEIGPGTIQTQAIAISDSNNISTATNFSLLLPTGILLFTPQTISSIGNTSGYFSIMANGGSSRIKMMSASTTFEKPIIIPGSSSLKFTNRYYTTNNTNETNTGNFGQMDFSTDAINILYNTNSATTPITNRIIVKNDRTTFYKPIEISVISANQPTVTPGVPNDYQNRTTKIEYKYNQSDGSYLNIDKPVKAVVNGESVFLGVPAYTMMTYPDTLPAPQGWERFEGNLILFTDNMSYLYVNTNVYNDSDDDFYVYYNNNDNNNHIDSHYRITAVNVLPSNFVNQPSNAKNIGYNSTPKDTVNSKTSISELLNMSTVIEVNDYDAIIAYANNNGKGTPGSGNTPSTIPKYEKLLRKMFRDRTTNVFNYGVGIITSDDYSGLFFPMPVAPTGFTYIFKTA
jgi:hypothetical protein